MTTAQTSPSHRSRWLFFIGFLAVGVVGVALIWGSQALLFADTNDFQRVVGHLYLTPLGDGIRWALPERPFRMPGNPELASHIFTLAGWVQRYLPGAVFDISRTALAAKLREVKNTELRAGFCLTGPHREDLEILIDGQPGKIYGSQGQQRSAVLSMKLAEASVAGEVLGEHPVMLLDDVLSELDDARQTYLLTRIEDKQTFVTTCDSAAFARTNGKLVFVDHGTVREG